VLNLTDEQTIERTLAIMPSALLKKLVSFVDRYTPAARVFNGPPPNMQTVRTVKRLLSKGNGEAEPCGSRLVDDWD